MSEWPNFYIPVPGSRGGEIQQTLELPDPRMDDTRLTALYDLWAGRREGRRLPGRSAFLAEEFKPWMGNISLFDVEQDPLRFRIRLSGSRIVEYDGTDFTGRYLDDVLPEDVASVVLSQFEAAVATRRALFVMSRTRYFRDLPAMLTRLFLPLAEDGERVDRLLVCLYADFRQHVGDQVFVLQDLERD